MAGNAAVRNYVLVFLALMVLTAVTVGVAFFDLGWGNDPLALLIATTKALLVVLFFMHARESTRLALLTVLASVIFLAILIGFVLYDVFTRPQPGIQDVRGTPASPCKAIALGYETCTAISPRQVLSLLPRPSGGGGRDEPAGISYPAERAVRGGQPSAHL